MLVQRKRWSATGVAVPAVPACGAELPSATGRHQPRASQRAPTAPQPVFPAPSEVFFVIFATAHAGQPRSDPGHLP